MCSMSAGRPLREGAAAGGGGGTLKNSVVEGASIDGEGVVIDVADRDSTKEGV